MRFDEARRRLARVPPSLPAMPPELVPVLLPVDGGSGPPRVPAFPVGPRRDAAVLILIHPDDEGRAVVVLAERSAGDHRHAGQISFPGGAIEEDDESVAAAALREAWEEVGLNAVSAGVEVVGVLAAVDVRMSGFVVHPVIAFANRAPRLAPDGREVVAILNEPLATFLPSAPIEIVTTERDGVRLRYGAYRVGHHLVWGVTAGILGRLGAYLAPAATATEPA